MWHMCSIFLFPGDFLTLPLLQQNAARGLEVLLVLLSALKAAQVNMYMYEDEEATEPQKQCCLDEEVLEKQVS